VIEWISVTLKKPKSQCLKFKQGTQYFFNSINKDERLDGYFTAALLNG